MSRLSVEINGTVQTFPITEKGLNIGRALENDIVLQHAFISRRHALVELRGREAWIKDFDSRNGLSVNRLRVKEEILNDGDLIQIGPYEIHYEERAAQSVVLDDNKYFPLSFGQVREAQSAELPELALGVREFYQISKRLSSIVDLRELLHAVMEEALRIVPAQRGLLMLNQGGELVPRVVFPADHGDVAISSTIARKAMEGEAVLTRDARLDFAGSQSIISANIRSALCVPLISDGKASGLIYLDSAGRDQFGDRERDLLSAVANYAGLNIERARLTDELRQQAERRQLFERFVSPNIASEVASYFSEHGRLREPEELTVSVLFADIKGFSMLSEKLSPRAMQDLLNEYLHDMTEMIFKHNGTLDKYIGDGIMALFGAPQLSDVTDPSQYAINAVAAGLDMIEAHRTLMARLDDPSRRFDFRIGVNTGLAYAGFFGTRQRLEYTVIGDAVNTASRLEGRAETNTVLISEATLQATGKRFRVQEMGDYQLKGKEKTVRTYKVLGWAEG
jgi:adenylate cyclase